MIPGVSINTNAGPQSTDVTVEAGVVNKNLNIDDQVENAPPVDTLNAPAGEIQPICDEKCQQTEPKQLGDVNKLNAPALNTTTVTTTPEPVVTKKTTKATSKSKKKVKHATTTGCTPAK